MYHCYFSYFETETKSQRRVNTTKSWNYPNLKAIMKDLKNRWIKERVPLTIKQHLSGKVKISHEMPSLMGSLAQLKLSPNLAYLLGYTAEVEKEGQYLRFDENKEFLAPHEPKLFMDYCAEKVKSENSSKLKKLEDVIRNLKDENKTLKKEFTGKLAKIKNEHKQDKIEIEELKKKLEDYSDRLEKSIPPTKDFDKIYDQPWVIKGVVTDKQLPNKGNWKEFNMTLKDYSGAITITAFDHNAELLDALIENGMEYYLSNVNDRNNWASTFIVHTVSINNNAYKVIFNAVK